jgi:hypothetical protein
LAYKFKGRIVIFVPFVTLGLIYFCYFLLKVKRSYARLVTMRHHFFIEHCIFTSFFKSMFLALFFLL